MANHNNPVRDSFGLANLAEAIGHPMLELLPPLNDHNLPWMDTIHPIVVHFVISSNLRLAISSARKTRRVPM